MFNNDVLEAIELLRKEIRTAQKETKNESREKVKVLVHEIIKDIAAKENKELKEREQNYREKYFEIASSIKGIDQLLATTAKKNSLNIDRIDDSLSELSKELSDTQFQLRQKQGLIDSLNMYEGKVNCILNNHVAFKDVSIPNAGLTYKIKVIIDYFLTEESTKE
jgi:hypothetical protein